MRDGKVGHRHAVNILLRIAGGIREHDRGPLDGLSVDGGKGVCLGGAGVPTVWGCADGSTVGNMTGELMGGGEKAESKIQLSVQIISVEARRQVADQRAHISIAVAVSRTVFQLGIKAGILLLQKGEEFIRPVSVLGIDQMPDCEKRVNGVGDAAVRMDGKGVARTALEPADAPVDAVIDKEGADGRKAGLGADVPVIVDGLHLLILGTVQMGKKFFVKFRKAFAVGQRLVHEGLKDLQHIEVIVRAAGISAAGKGGLGASAAGEFQSIRICQMGNALPETLLNGGLVVKGRLSAAFENALCGKLPEILGHILRHPKLGQRSGKTDGGFQRLTGDITVFGTESDAPAVVFLYVQHHAPQPGAHVLSAVVGGKDGIQPPDIIPTVQR